jgi:hypothetical protein
MIVDRERLLVDWNRRPDGRRYKVRIDRRARSVYIQILRLELVGWY